jgi:hypothetical protein
MGNTLKPDAYLGEIPIKKAPINPSSDRYYILYKVYYDNKSKHYIYKQSEYTFVGQIQDKDNFIGTLFNPERTLDITSTDGEITGKMYKLPKKTLVYDGGLTLTIERFGITEYLDILSNGIGQLYINNGFLKYKGRFLNNSQYFGTVYYPRGISYSRMQSPYDQYIDYAVVEVEGVIYCIHRYLQGKHNILDHATRVINIIVYKGPKCEEKIIEVKNLNESKQLNDEGLPDEVRKYIKF